MAGKPPNWKCLKAEMQSRVRRVDYARGNGVSESSSPPPLCFTTTTDSAMIKRSDPTGLIIACVTGSTDLIIKNK